MRSNISFVAATLFLAISVKGQDYTEGAQCINFDDCADGLECVQHDDYVSFDKYCRDPTKDECFWSDEVGAYACSKPGYACNEVHAYACEPECTIGEACPNASECCGEGLGMVPFAPWTAGFTTCSKYHCD